MKNTYSPTQRQHSSIIHTWEISEIESLCRVWEARLGLAGTVSPLLFPESGWWEEVHEEAAEDTVRHPLMEAKSPIFNPSQIRSQSKFNHLNIRIRSGLFPHIINIIFNSFLWNDAASFLTVLWGGRGCPGTGCVMSSNLPEHPSSSRDSGRSMGPTGGTSATQRGANEWNPVGRNSNSNVQNNGENDPLV